MTDPKPGLLPLLDDAMATLGRSRPVFYNEADFQHALAWELHLRYPDGALRLEVPYSHAPTERLDLSFAAGGHTVAIELKYPRAPFRAELPGEASAYSRANQDAEDDTRYAIVRDIERIEGAIGAGQAQEGAVVVLTNISSMWRVPVREVKAMDAAFRIHEGVALSGQLTWGAGGRPKQTVELVERYACAWRQYSRVDVLSGSGDFRYACLIADASSAG